MTSLSVFYASAPHNEVPVSTLDIRHSSFEPILTCSGFENQTVITEMGNTLLMLASGLDVSLPARNSTGQQNLTFAIENVTGEAQNAINSVIDSDSLEPMRMVYRLYLASQLNVPKLVLPMIIVSAEFQGLTTQVTGSYMDIINRKWPRRRYTAGFAPGIRYISA